MIHKYVRSDDDNKTESCYRQTYTMYQLVGHSLRLVQIFGVPGRLTRVIGIVRLDDGAKPNITSHHIIIIINNSVRWLSWKHVMHIIRNESAIFDVPQ